MKTTTALIFAIVLTGCTTTVTTTETTAPATTQPAATETQPATAAPDPGIASNEWTATATPIADITEAVLAENEFNEPPADGLVFAGFDLTLTLDAAPEGTGSPGIDYTVKLEGATQIYDAYTLGDGNGCGVIPGEFDQFAELKEGGTVTGTVCIPIPADELGTVAIVLDPLFGERVIVPTS